MLFWKSSLFWKSFTSQLTVHLFVFKYTFYPFHFYRLLLSTECSLYHLKLYSLGFWCFLSIHILRFSIVSFAICKTKIELLRTTLNNKFKLYLRSLDGWWTHCPLKDWHVWNRSDVRTGLSRVKLNSLVYLRTAYAEIMWMSSTNTNVIQLLK